MRKFYLILLVLAIISCKKDNEIEYFVIENQLNNFCYSPSIIFDNGEIYLIKNNIVSFSSRSESILSKSEKFVFQYQNQNGVKFISCDYYNIDSDIVYIDHRVKYRLR